MELSLCDKILADIERTTFQAPIRRGMSQGEGAGCVKEISPLSMCDRIMLEIDDNWMKVNKTPNVGSAAKSMPSMRSKSKLSYSCDKGATVAVETTGAMPLSLCEKFRQEIDEELSVSTTRVQSCSTFHAQRFRKRRRIQAESSEDSGVSSDSESGLDAHAQQLAVVDALMQDSAPDGTLTQDNSHWKTWSSACRKVGISPLRVKKRRTATQKRAERKKLAYVLWTLYNDMKPRSKADPAAKPSSAYQVFLGAKRVHERQGYTLMDGEMVPKVMKALTKQYIKKFGYRALVKKRKEPLTNSMIQKFMMMPEGTQLGCVTVRKSSRGYMSWRCLNATAANTGFRKDEIATKSMQVGLTKVQLTRASLVFVKHGKYDADPAPEWLMDFDDTCGVLLKPRPSKADQDGAFWCDKPIYFPFHMVSRVNPARELVQREIMLPVRGAKREEVPLFETDAGVPFTKRQVDTAFKAMIRLVVPLSEVDKYTFHGYRIYLACALDEAGCPPAKIKRILRWVSDESLLNYVRDGERMYTTWLDRKDRTVIKTIQVSNLPSPYDPILNYVDCDTDVEDEDD